MSERQEKVGIVYPFSFQPMGAEINPMSCEPSRLHRRLTLKDTLLIQGLGDYQPTVNPPMGQAIFARALTPDSPAHIVLRPVCTPGNNDTYFHQLAFVRELAVLQELAGPNVPEVYGIATTNDGTFSVTEHVQGATLHAILDQRDKERESGNFDEGYYLSVATSAFLAVARQAGRAHEKGIIHRDIKPGNIVVADDGRVVLIDWKTAYRIGDNEEEYILNTGTPGFAAIEQFAGHVPTPATDIHALGVVLYLIFGGVFPEDRMIGNYVFITEDEVTAIRERYPQRGASRNIADIILQAIAVDAVDRYQSVEAFLDDLLPCLQQLVVNTMDRSDFDTSRFIRDEYALRRETFAEAPTSILDVETIPTQPLAL